MTDKRPVAVLFDLDGTLVRLPVDIDGVRSELAAQFEPLGYSGEFRPILSCIDEAARVAGQGDPAVQKRLRREARGVLSRAEVDAAARLGICAGARTLLAALSRARVPLGLVTNNGRTCVPACLRALGAEELFDSDAVVTRDDAPWKPDPRGLLAAMAALLPGGGPVAYLGDSRADVEAAAAAGQDSRFDVVMVRIGEGEALAGERVVSDLRHAGDTLRELFELGLGADQVSLGGEAVEVDDR